MEDLIHPDNVPAWGPRETIPLDGTEVHVQSVYGSQPDDGELFFEGLASYRNFISGPVDDPISGVRVIPKSEMFRWVRSDVNKVVPGRIVRWRPKFKTRQIAQKEG